jgi:hypothetical protein
MGLNVCDMTSKWGIYEVKCICNSGWHNKGTTCAMCEYVYIEIM